MSVRLVQVPVLGASLGTIARNSSGLSGPSVEPYDRNKVRALRFALQSEARRLLPDERVSQCMRSRRPDRPDVEVWHFPIEASARYRNLVTCHSVWHDPVCCSHITESRALELLQAVTYARANGLRVLLESLTFAHRAWDALRPAVDLFVSSLALLSGGRLANEIRRRFGVVGQVRAFEVTWGRLNGWHPHAHILAFVSAEVDIEAFAAARRVQWELAAARRGLSMNEHGYSCEDSNERIAQYLAKFDRLPRWDVHQELSKWHVKRGRGDHVTPFELLAQSFAGDREAGDRFREYARVFKGRHQLEWSPQLRAILELGEVRSDAAIVDGSEDTSAYLLGRLSPSQWRGVLANDARAEVLAAASTGSWSAVCDVLAAVGVA